MRFTRHAKNEMRWKGWTRQDVLEVISNPVEVDADEHANPRFLGYIRGNLVRVVVAGDDSGVVITVHPRRRS
jgi:hypothetical protein